MNFKVLIYFLGFSVLGFSILCLLYFVTGSSEDAPSQKSLNSDAEHLGDGGSREKQELLDAAQKDVPSNPTDASPSLQHLTTDGRIGELQISEDNGISVDVIWQIPNFLILPYRKDAGIISPDFDSYGFKGYFIMDPKGSMNTSEMISINSLIIPKERYFRESYLRVFLKAEDGTLKTYVPSVSFSNYFTCNVPKMDIIGDKESMVPGGVLIVLFKLSLVDYGGNSNPEIRPSICSKNDVGDLNARRISSSEFAATWVFQDFFSLAEYRKLTGSLPQISSDFYFPISLTPKGYFDEAGFTKFELRWYYKFDFPPEKWVDYPKFSCKFSLKTRENTLYNMTQEKYHVALYGGGSCYCLVPWSEIYERKDVVVPGGELTLMLDFHWESEDVEPETQTGSSPEAEDEELRRIFPEVTVTEPT